MNYKYAFYVLLSTLLTHRRWYIVTGDSGYPLEPWLMTPLGTATSRAETAYNNAHSKTRTVVERCFGLMKSRFRCLDKTGGTLLYSAEKTCRLVTAVAVLHNYSIDHKIPAAIDRDVVNRHAAIQPLTNGPAVDQQQETATAVAVRHNVIQLF